jgi:hypothetical protein
VTLPWGNINQIEVVFSKNVAVDPSDLLLSGVNTPAYNVSGGTFSYNSSTFTATWTLPQAIGPDKLLLQLNADGSDPIEDSTGSRLDGEWTNPTTTTDTGTSAYPSGNGTAGGNFSFRFNVLPGDANQDGSANFSDLSRLLANYGKSTGESWGQGDFTGDGAVNFSDLSELLADYGQRLPSGEPTPGTFPADILLVAASVPTTVSSESAISVTPLATVTAPATSTSDSTDDVVAIASPDVVASGQVAVPATSSVIEAVVPAIASTDGSVVTSQPAYLENESQPTAPSSLSAQVSLSPSTVTAAAESVAESFPADALLAAASVPTTVSSESAIPATPVTTADTPATSTSDSTDDVVAIASPDVVASGQVAVPATSSVIEAAVPAIASTDGSVVTSQPAYLENESQPAAPSSLSAQVSLSLSTVTAVPSPTTQPGTRLTLNGLMPVVGEAITRSVGAGVNAATPQKVTQVPLVVGALPGSSLGEAEAKSVDLDTSAANNGRLVDATLAGEEEVTPAQNNRPLPAVDPRVVDQTDLSTVVGHELGHVAGSSDADALTGDVLSGVLDAGVRRNVSATDAVLASS